MNFQNQIEYQSQTYQDIARNDNKRSSRVTITYGGAASPTGAEGGRDHYAVAVDPLAVAVRDDGQDGLAEKLVVTAGSSFKRVMNSLDTNLIRNYTNKQIYRRFGCERESTQIISIRQSQMVNK